MPPRIEADETRTVLVEDDLGGSSGLASTESRDPDQAQMPAPYAFTNSTTHGMEVCYLALDRGNTARHVDDLRAFGFEISIYTSIAALRSSLSADASPLVALQAEAMTVHLAVAQLRLAFQGGGIVVIADFPDRLSRVGAILSGADSCVAAMPESRELMAALLASKRRLQVEDMQRKRDDTLSRPSCFTDDGARRALHRAGDMDAFGRWRLEDHGWVLVAPNGAKLELNHSERKIMAQFFSNPREPLTRLSQGASYDPESGRITRALDVTISRLKKKAAESAMRLPIRSIRGKGYVFVSNDPLDVSFRETHEIRS